MDQQRETVTLTDLVIACVVIAFLFYIAIPKFKESYDKADPPAPAQLEMSKGTVADSDATRFKIQRVATFDDNLAYEGGRGVYVMVDQKTGREYVGVSGIGIAELGSHMVGKVPQQDER